MLLTDLYRRSTTARGVVRTAPIVALAALAVGATVVPAAADPLPYGPETCISPYVWRAARPGDAVCVTTDMRSTIAAQNANAGANKDPNGAYGPESCAQGYVWRQAFDGDTVCVTPDFRSQVLADNAASPSRKAANTPANTPPANGAGMVTFEVTGTGHVYSIVTDPDGGLVPDGTSAPWTRTMPDPGDSLYQVVVTTKDGSQGCRILLDGTVVAEQPIGGSGHCIYKP